MSGRCIFFVQNLGYARPVQSDAARFSGLYEGNLDPNFLDFVIVLFQWNQVETG
jgi:hypothetical protein